MIEYGNNKIIQMNVRSAYYFFEKHPERYRRCHTADKQT